MSNFSLSSLGVEEDESLSLPSLGVVEDVELEESQACIVAAQLSEGRNQGISQRQVLY